MGKSIVSKVVLVFLSCLVKGYFRFFGATDSTNLTKGWASNSEAEGLESDSRTEQRVTRSWNCGENCLV